MLKASFVIPWYGREIPGGAEAECRGVAENLAARGVETEILTTCLHSHGRSWDRDFHPPGQSVENKVTVRRFPVDPRNAPLFNLLNRRLMAGLPLPPRQETAFLENMVNSRALYHFISKAQGRLFLPLPYLFSTTWMTARLAPDRTIPIACLHDEGYAYLAPLRRAFLRCPAMIFLSRAEKRLAEKLWGLEERRSLLFGAGVDTDPLGSSDVFRAKYHIINPFVLYAGRRDATKNTPLLIDCFTRYKKGPGKSRGLKLILIGNQSVSIPPEMEGEIIDLGFVSKEDKAGAFAAAELFCQPSVHESFSIVIMESWLNHAPVLVHRGCAVTRDHVERCGGGLTFSGPDDFAQAVESILNAQGKAFAMAEAGRRYVMDNFTWDQVCGRYIRLLEEAEGGLPISPKSSARIPTPPRIRQVISSSRPGTNVLGESWSIAHLLEKTGRHGGIYVPQSKEPPSSGHRPLRWLGPDLGPEDAVLLHYDATDPNFRFPEKVWAASGNILLIRLHGSVSAYPAIRAELDSLLTLNDDKKVIFLTGTEAGKGDLEEAGLHPVQLLPAVLPPEEAWASSNLFQFSRPQLAFLGGDPGNAIKAFALLKRLRPQATLLLLEDERVPMSAGRRSDTPGLAGLKGVSIPEIHEPSDLSLILSGADLIIQAGDDIIPSWAIAHSILLGKPVIGGSRYSSPALLAEALNALLEDDSLRGALIEEQREELGIAGTASFDLLQDLLRSFWGPEPGPE